MRDGRYSQCARRLLTEELEHTPDNTKLAYDKKELLFVNFCNQMYKDSTNYGEYPSLVTEEKMFGFLYYQSRRAKTKTGKKKNKMIIIL